MIGALALNKMSVHVFSWQTHQRSLCWVETIPHKTESGWTEVRLDKPFSLKSFQRPFSFYFICKNHCSQTSNGLCMTDIKTSSQYIHKVTSAASLHRTKITAKPWKYSGFHFRIPGRVLHKRCSFLCCTRTIPLCTWPAVFQSHCVNLTSHPGAQCPDLTV